MFDIECPYCGHDFDVDAEATESSVDGGRFEQECPRCEKVCMVTTSVTYYYEAETADCLNGAEHSWRKVVHSPPHFPNWERCSACDAERGKDEPVLEPGR